MRLALIIVGGIAARLLLLLIVDPFAHPFTGDALAYATHAHPSLYSFLFVIDWRAIIVLQCALTIGSAVGAYLVLRSFWAGLAIAICPFFAFYDFRLLSESMYVNLIFWAFMLYRQTAWSGALLGVAILVRSIFFFLPAFVFAVRRSRTSAIFAGVAYLVALPAITFLEQEHNGLTLWIGTWERTPAWYGHGHGLNHPAFPRRAHVTESEAMALQRGDDEALRYAAVERIERNPADVLLSWIIRYPRLWIGSRSDQIKWRIRAHFPLWITLKGSLFALNLALLAFGIFGLFGGDKLLVLPVIYTALIYVPFHNAETRYSLLTLPFLIVLGVRKVAQLSTGQRAWRSTLSRSSISTLSARLRRLSPSTNGCPRQ